MLRFAVLIPSLALVTSTLFVMASSGCAAVAKDVDEPSRHVDNSASTLWNTIAREFPCGSYVNDVRTTAARLGFRASAYFTESTDRFALSMPPGSNRALEQELFFEFDDASRLRQLHMIEIEPHTSGTAFTVNCNDDTAQRDVIHVRPGPFLRLYCFQRPRSDSSP